jgi:hypothetical protein
LIGSFTVGAFKGFDSGFNMLGWNYLVNDSSKFLVKA